ncbi:hypothetical protein [Enterococcus pallens]|uniref:Uncharacterized protein n=1 Tax=Enterococcus pallens ATCC BAA-351 TaxID=1158607 RepID=R2SHR6_9ENTE|nr:hypothetical protein [Enterococcus pallens]EOH94820.1 hypothetical protein UAU_01742 [Enterococcus pallens ATCC BAA-351]EOU14861.1 hypothetical protein I588_04511 [Enterococcus pallens ATCC BAA-351]
MSDKLLNGLDLNELRQHILGRDHLDIVADFTIQHIDEWNFFKESFDSFTDRMEEEVVLLSRVEY